jgi:DNA-binding NarL/FixJ family response regulator
MAGVKLTYLLCLDDHRNFTEEIRKRFSDESRYRIETFHDHRDLIARFRRGKEKNTCKIAIISVPDSTDQLVLTESLTLEIGKANASAGIILLVSPDKMDEARKAIRFNIDAYVPRNTNSVLRIHNAVKKLISEQNIIIFRKRRNLALYALTGFTIIVVLIVLITRLKLPQYY